MDTRRGALQRGLGVGLAVGTLLAPSASATALADGAGEGGTQVEALSASVSNSSIAVEGRAVFGDGGAVVGEDPGGDAAIPASGADLVEARISRPDPSRGSLTFTLRVADQPPVLGGTPYLVYNWAVAVDGLDAGYVLHAGRVYGYLGPSANPTFSLLRVVGEFIYEVAKLEGHMGDGVVAWEQVPMGALGASEDSIVSPGHVGVLSTLGVGGTFFLGGAEGDEIAVRDFTVPRPTVRLGIAPASTPPSDVTLPYQATIDVGTGEFSVKLPKPGQPGGYVLVAEACYGEENCGSGHVDVVI